MAIHCKYVAVDAVQALAQVYQQLMKMHPHDYQIPQRWAKILISAPLNRPEDGCDVLETAANSANIQGGADCSINIGVVSATNSWLTALRLWACFCKTLNAAHSKLRPDMNTEATFCSNALGFPGDLVCSRATLTICHIKKTYWLPSLTHRCDNDMDQSAGLLQPCLDALSSFAKGTPQADMLSCVKARDKLRRALTKHDANSMAAKRAAYAYIGAKACSTPPVSWLLLWLLFSRVTQRAGKFA